MTYPDPKLKAACTQLASIRRTDLFQLMDELQNLSLAINRLTASQASHAVKPSAPDRTAPCRTFRPMIHRHIEQQAQRLATRSGLEPDTYVGALRADMIDQLATAICLLADGDDRARTHLEVLADQFTSSTQEHDHA